MTRLDVSSSRRLGVAAFAKAALMCAILVALPARADEKRTCLASYEQSQRLRMAGKLRASREQLLLCVREVCPAALRKDCSDWLSQVEQAMPSVVFVAQRPDGQRVTSVRVAIDGTVVSERLDGKAVEIDPGQHTVRYELEGLAPADVSLTVSQGDKNRLVEIQLPRAPGDASPATSSSETRLPPDQARPSDRAASTRPVPPLALVLAGVGAVGVGVFAYFGIAGLNVRSDLDACKGGCAEADVDEGKRDFLIGDTALVVGVAALGLATVLFVTRPSVPKRTAATWATFAW
jgi:hypothetical protein